jgi:hypothetical protein
MRVSPDLLDAVEAALPAAGDAAIAPCAVHDRVGAWNRRTVRHALRALVQSGRARFTGGDRHRKYRRAGATEPRGAEPGAGQAMRPASRRAGGRTESWRDYALRGDGSVRLPDGHAVAKAMAKHGLRYGDVDAAELRREERLAGWSVRRPTSAALTRAIFGDPQPGRRKPP